MTQWTLPNALEVLRKEFPGAFVTSGRRDPNSKLGRANPRSYHNHGQAFDIRPMQGVNFNDYVSKLKAAGLPVVEALDEATNPKPWTTGPNWHVAFATSGGESPYYAGIKGREDKKPMLTPEQRAAMFNIDLPGQDPEPWNLQKALAQASLRDMPGFDEALKRNAEKGAEKSKGPPTWAKILGVISDAYLNANGGKGQFAPTVAHMRELEAEQNFAREKLQEQIAAQKESLLFKLQNPVPTQTDRYIAEIMDPNTPPQRKAILRQIIMRPIAVPTYNEDGSQSMNFYYPDSLPQQSGDEWEYFE